MILRAQIYIRKQTKSVISLILQVLNSVLLQSKGAQCLNPRTLAYKSVSHSPRDLSDRNDQDSLITVPLYHTVLLKETYRPPSRVRTYRFHQDLPPI